MVQNGAPCEIMNANTSASNACIVHILVSIFMFLMFYEQLGNVLYNYVHF